MRFSSKAQFWPETLEVGITRLFFQITGKSPKIPRNGHLFGGKSRIYEEFFMPNHFHAIVLIYNDVLRATGRSPLPKYGKSLYPHGPTPKSLGALVAGFKSSATKRINILRNAPGVPLWQRNYYEHIIRNEEDYERIFNYIATNPTHWAEDEENR